MYKGGDPFGPETEAIVPTIVVICNAQGKAQCDSRRNADGNYQAKGRRKQVSVADLEDLALLVSHHQAYKAAALHGRAFAGKSNSDFNV